MWSWVLMRDGEITPCEQSRRVASAAPAAAPQLTSTQVIVPLESTSTSPAGMTASGARTMPRRRTPAVPRFSTLQAAPVATGPPSTLPRLPASSRLVPLTWMTLLLEQATNTAVVPREKKAIFLTCAPLECAESSTAEKAGDICLESVS